MAAVARVDAETGGLQYDSSQPGSLGTITDCAGGVDQIVNELGGTQLGYLMFDTKTYGDWYNQPGKKPEDK